MGNLLLLSPLLLIGLAYIVWSAVLITEAIRVRSWVETSARIDVAELHDRPYRVRSKQGRKPTYRTRHAYRATVEYSYEFDEQPYQSDTIQRIHLSRFWYIGMNLGSHHKEWGTWLKRNRGKSIPCFVNPKQPDQAVLDRSLRWELIGYPGLFALPCLLIFVLFAWPGGAAKPSRENIEHN